MMEYQKAMTLSEAVALNAAYLAFPVLAGGTDLMVAWHFSDVKPAGVVDISRADGLSDIAWDENGVEIGACATHSAITSDSKMIKKFPLLVQACKSVGSIQIRNRGTIGGNIMNASPAGDCLPALLAYGAELKLQDIKGERWVSIADFYTGYRKTAKLDSELLTRVRIRFGKWKDEKYAFYKLGVRKAQAISKVSLCVRADIDHGAIRDIIITVGSVAPTVVRASGTEAMLKGKIISSQVLDYAKKSIADEFFPIDDIRSTASYRRFACSSLLIKFLRDAL